MINALHTMWSRLLLSVALFAGASVCNAATQEIPPPNSGYVPKKQLTGTLREGQTRLESDGRFLPLTASMARAQLKKLN